MAYHASDLSVLAYANGFTLWHYEARDLIADLTAPTYFDPADDLFRRGDRIEAVASDAMVALCVVHCEPGTVRVVAMSPIVAFT